MALGESAGKRRVFWFRRMGPEEGEVFDRWFLE
jgi:hypothetical protein